MTVAAYLDRATAAYPVSLDAIRTRADALFGVEPPQDVLDALALDAVEAVDAPSYDPATQTLAEGAPALVDGVWRQTWVVEPIPPPPVPEECSPLQFRRAVRHVSAKPIFDAYVAQLDEEDRETLEYATTIRRFDPMIEKARVAIGWTHEQVAGLFVLAVTL